MAKHRVAALGLALILLGGVVGTRFTRSKTYRADPAPFANAQMGYAPDIGSAEDADVTLRYLALTWREVEPEEGVFDWEGIEERYGLSALHEQGVHLVFRFLCDLPGTEQHLDIPDWLYAQTGDGSWYTTSYGSGYSPDYSNPVFLAAHEKVLTALGEHFGRDGFFSYVELGSLGHWGEWHVKSSDGLVPMPEESIRDAYAAVYQTAFPEAKLLMRRPFRFAAENALGLYNDMTGAPEDTEEWLGWISGGGWYGDEPDALVPMPDFWRTAPSGGEFTSSISMEQMLSTDLSQTLELLRRSHTIFLGPKIADPDAAAGYDAVLRELGYRLQIQKASLRRRAGQTILSLTLANEGSTPFYWDWPIHLYVEDPNGTTLETQPLSLSLSSLQPGTSQTAEVTLDSVTKLFSFSGTKRISIGIVDPMTGRDAVRLAIRTKTQDGRTILFENVE